MEITRLLGRFVAGTPAGATTTEARLQARRAILDTLGVTLAGSRAEASRVVAGLVREQGGAAEAAVLGHGLLRAPAAGAALVNGTSGHALDFDDVSAPMRGHPSVPLLPAVLALGEKLGASGCEVMEAFVLGFEVEAKLGRAIGGAHYSLGWHATSTLGTLGAAAASARLLRLDAERAARALAIACSLASGVQQNFGTMTKPLHAGWAAHNGVIAAILAQRGLTADARALEGQSGFLRAASGGAEVDTAAAVRDLGEPWEIVSPGIGVKLYPCCYGTHRAIDAALELRKVDGFDPALVRDITVKVTPGTLTPLLGRPPATGLEAKFSLEYCVVTALWQGKVGLADFTDDAARRPELQKIIRCVRVIEDGPRLNFPIEGIAEVSVTAGGRELSARVETPRGDPARPLSWEELSQKFRDCASAMLGPGAIDRTIAAVQGLEEMADVSELVRLLSA